MEYEPKYTVVLRGQEFVLSKSQIEFDSPNCFTACFLGDFRKAETKRLELSRNPDLFRLILEHLCGYEILPLDDNVIPSHMLIDSVLRNLQADALFYQLDGLIKSCNEVIAPRGVPGLPSRSFMVIGYTTSARILSNTGPNSNYNITVRMLKPEERWPIYYLE
ncbi:BTB domain protein, putative [Rhizoctonia solani AG-3 Rhs1AP]|uniref:BTB domain protein, putative n=2 Tax=Rhizoctonia solani AG-3 TaxID=1086053 RepID=X8J3G5_9AGAM|nr:BTB domain protein, putative [Rhizoctonia solani AG-3 Rhs1AP]KEP47451.1 putative BTB domain protein [Rhizoctonia solani 123E]